MLIDTSGFLCLYDEDENHHKDAVRFYDNARFRITTNYILSEYVALAYVRSPSPGGNQIQLSSIRRSADRNSLD